jgi:hypothetical protein
MDAMASSDHVSFSLRLAPATLSKVDEFATGWESENPGARCSRTMALRMLLSRGLEVASRGGVGRAPTTGRRCSLGRGK